ncbi:isoprenoid synthase domain-containing protein [Aspergillus multicolor]|uniref:isoprenoid synthase domain-containing protein n=1 Tax=Aspergillus multicolor TaxID=41759 RepID=UPI003CCDB97C
MDEARADFEKARVDIIYEAIEYFEERSLASRFVDVIRARLIKALDRTSMFSGLTLLSTARTTSPTPLTAQQTDELSLLDWICELFHAAHTMCDEDNNIDNLNSTSQPETSPGTAAPNNTPATAGIRVFCSLIPALIKRRFATHPRYTAILELFLQAEMNMSLGQVADMQTAAHDVGTAGIDPHSWEVYEFMVEQTTTFPAFYLPIVLALEYLQVATEQIKKQVKHILQPIGIYVQIRNEVRGAGLLGDVQSDRERIGTRTSVGNSNARNAIAGNKCNWLIMHALDRADKDQKVCLLETYGRKDAGAIDAVIGVYKELDLERVFRDYEGKAHRQIQSVIDGLDEGLGLRKELFRALFDGVKR